jgi:hypothetical protein
VTTYLLGFLAPSPEPAPRWSAGRTRHIAGEYDPPPSPLAHRIGDWRRRQQSLRIRMGGRFENPVARRAFNDPTQVHHRDTIRHMADHSEIVRNKKDTRFRCGSGCP